MATAKKAFAAKTVAKNAAAKKMPAAKSAAKKAPAKKGAAGRFGSVFTADGATTKGKYKVDQPGKTRKVAPKP